MCYHGHIACGVGSVLMDPKLFNEKQESAIIGLAWCDKTPFESIEQEYGVSERQVKEIMRRSLKQGSYRLWRKRVRGRSKKHGSRHQKSVKKLQETE